MARFPACRKQFNAYSVLLAECNTIDFSNNASAVYIWENSGDNTSKLAYQDNKGIVQAAESQSLSAGGFLSNNRVSVGPSGHAAVIAGGARTTELWFHGPQDQSWSAGGVVSTETNGLAYQGSVAVDGSGTSYVVWVHRTGTNDPFEVHLKKKVGSGRLVCIRGAVLCRG